MRMQYIRTLVNNTPSNAAIEDSFRTVSVPKEFVNLIFKDADKVVVTPLPDFSGIIIKPAKVVPVR